MTPTLDALAVVMESIASSSSRNRKLQALAEWLQPLEDEDLWLALRFLSAKPVQDENAAPIGGGLLREALLHVCPWPGELLRYCYREVGDTGETIALLMRGQATAANQAAPLSLRAAAELYRNIFATADRNERIDRLAGAYQRLPWLTLKYFVKIITGSFRIGMQQKLVEEAAARAVGADAVQFRQAVNRNGDLPAVTLAARRGELDSMGARLFHPLEFMLAQSVEQHAAQLQRGEWQYEDKFDGIRAQLHVANGEARIFSRGMEDASASFPEILQAAHTLNNSAIIDGEVLAWREGRPLSFGTLQTRLSRQKPSATLLQETPVIFMAYDVLFHNGQLLLDAPLQERRARLEQLLAGNDAAPLRISTVQPLQLDDDLEALYQAARQRGNEGLLLKQRGSLYESGRRSNTWLKVKRAWGTLDVVVTAAEQGHGKRATLLSDYTFAVRDGERWLNVGKAYSGLTDEELRELTRIFRGLTTGRYGRVALVSPEVVLEVAFDGIQRSPRHKSGFALRFPRILRWRQDKQAQEADTLYTLEQMFTAQP
jgi:DNA ligase 1